MATDNTHLPLGGPSRSSSTQPPEGANGHQPEAPQSGESSAPSLFLPTRQERRPRGTTTKRILGKTGRLVRRIKPHRLVNWQKLGSEFTMARQKQGFWPRILTGLVLGILLIAASIKGLHGLVMVVIVVGTIVSYMLMMKLLLNNADKPARTAPDSVLIPTKGPRRWQYAVHKAYGYPDKVPKANAKQELRWKNQLKIERLRELARFVQPTIWVGNGKGNAGKSINTAAGGSTMAEYLRGRDVLAMLASGNTTTGTIGKLTGLRGLTLTVRQQYKQLKQLVTPRALNNVAHTNRHGLRVISEHPGGGRTDDEGQFTDKKFEANYENAFDKTEFLWEDCGNDDVEEGSVVVAAMRKAVIALFTTFVGAPQTRDMVGETMADFKQYAKLHPDDSTKVRGQRKVGEDIPLLEKINHAVIVFCGLKKGESLEDYLQYVPEGFQGLVLGIRWDDYLSQVVEDINIWLMDKETQGDFLELDITLLEQAAWLLGIEVPPRHPAIQRSKTVLEYPLTNQDRRQSDSLSNATNGASTIPPVPAPADTFH